MINRDSALPGRAVAKLDLRLVPNQTHAEAMKKLRAHLDEHGFKMNLSGGYDPTGIHENSRLIRFGLGRGATPILPTNIS